MNTVWIHLSEGVNGTHPTIWSHLRKNPSPQNGKGVGAISAKKHHGAVAQNEGQGWGFIASTEMVSQAVLSWAHWANFGNHLVVPTVTHELITKRGTVVNLWCGLVMSSGLVVSMPKMSKRTRSLMCPHRCRWPSKFIAMKRCLWMVLKCFKWL